MLSLSCFLILLTGGSVRGAEGSATPATLRIQTAAAPASQPAADPVPVPEPSEKALSYYRSGNILWVVNAIRGLLVPALFLFSGVSARVRTWARHVGRRWFFIVSIYFAVFWLLEFVIDLPLRYYQDFVREHAYGLSNMSLGKWSGDSLKELSVELVVGVLSLWLPYLLLKKSPRHWWFYTGLLSIPFLLFAAFVQPIWIDPLFNKFGPMKNRQLEAKIVHLADRAGIEGSRVYEVEKSEDTRAIDAYVTGVAETKRIVLWDTIIEKLDEAELLAVMGHEIGHYVLGHVWKTILLFSLLIIASLYVIHRTAGGLIRRYQARFGFDELSDIASFPLIRLLAGAYLFIILPLPLAYSRHNEHEADRFALELTQNNQAAATALVKLQTENLAVPRPGLLYKLWRASHPTLGERIEFSNRYRPWEKNEPLKYRYLFNEQGGGPITKGFSPREPLFAAVPSPAQRGRDCVCKCLPTKAGA